jgi:hypothetical protein
MSQTFALISRETLNTIPGAIRKDGAISDRWWSRASKAWLAVGGRFATMQIGKRGTSAAGGLYLVASQADYYGDGASNRMRADFYEALNVAGPTRLSA